MESLTQNTGCDRSIYKAIASPVAISKKLLALSLSLMAVSCSASADSPQPAVSEKAAVSKTVVVADTTDTTPTEIVSNPQLPDKVTDADPNDRATASLTPIERLEGEFESIGDRI